MTSTVILPGLGIPTSTTHECFEMARNVYMGPVTEPLLVAAPAIVHVTCGILLRGIRMATAPAKRPRERDIVIQDESRDDIGLGGLATIVGLGYKKSWISTNFPSLTPLSASGYVLAAAVGYHYFRMKWSPAAIDGDSSLITLAYVTHYLRDPNWLFLGKLFNGGMLLILLWGSFYHIVSGILRYRRLLSMRARKNAYGVIAVLTGLSVISLTRFARWDLHTGFIGRKFASYLFA